MDDGIFVQLACTTYASPNHILRDEIEFWVEELPNRTPIPRQAGVFHHPHMLGLSVKAIFLSAFPSSRTGCKAHHGSI